MECNIKVKSYFCDVDHKSAVKNFRVVSIYFNHFVDDLFFAAFLIESASLQNDKWRTIMAKNAQFYLLNPEKKITVEQLACDLAAQAWRLGKRVLIACETEEQAFLIDEALWQRDPNEFVPHNLSGEATQYAPPIEISWKGKRNAQRRDLLINLQIEVPDFSHSFTQLIDFVPVEETQKAQARERYKILRSQGWALSTENT